MARSFNVWPPNNPRALIRLGLGFLAAANLVALYFVIRPIGGSAQDLAQQALEMHSAIRQQQGVLERTRLLAGKMPHKVGIRQDSGGASQRIHRGIHRVADGLSSYRAGACHRARRRAVYTQQIVIGPAGQLPYD